jgi:hypothetical protein
MKEDESFLIQSRAVEAQFVGRRLRVGELELAGGNFGRCAKNRPVADR